MEDWFGKLKQSIKGNDPSPSQNQQPQAPSDPNVTRIDLKTASHSQIIDFVKRQNQHIKQLESLISRYETKHAEYKKQLEQQSNSSSTNVSLNEVHGDDLLKKRIRDLTIERDALAAELQELEQSYHALQASLQSTSSNVNTSLINNTGTSFSNSDEIEKLNQKIQKIHLERTESEARLNETIDSLNKELLEKTKKIGQLNSHIQTLQIASEALKSKFQTLAEQQNSNQNLASQIQTKENQLKEMQSNIELLQSQLKEQKEMSEKMQQKLNEQNELQSQLNQLKLTIEERNSENNALRLEIEGLKANQSSENEDKQEVEKHDSNLILSDSASSENPSASDSAPSDNSIQSELLEKDSKIQQLEAKIQSNKEILAKAHKHLGDLTGQLSESRASVSSLMQQVSDLQSQNSELQSKIQNMEEESQKKITEVVASELKKELAVQLGRLTASQKSRESELLEKIRKLEDDLVASEEEYNKYRMLVNEQAQQQLQQQTQQQSQQQSNPQSHQQSTTSSSESDTTATSNNNSESELVFSDSSASTILKLKFDALSSKLLQLETANAELSSVNDTQAQELNSFRRKYESVLSKLKQNTESDSNLAATQEKFQQQIKALEIKHHDEIAQLQTQHELNTQALNTKLASLRQKADEIIKQKDSELANLKDMIEVLKLQVMRKSSDTILSRSSASSLDFKPVISDDTGKVTKRSGSKYDSDSPTRRRLASPENSDSAPVTSSQTSSTSTPRGSNEYERRNSSEGRHNEVPKLVQRVNQLSSQVFDLEQMLALAREQERLLKSELRKTERIVALSKADADTPNSQATTIATSENSALRKYLKSILESGEAPSLHILSDLLSFSTEEMAEIRNKMSSRNSAQTSLAASVGDGLNSLWKVFGTPSRN